MDNPLTVIASLAGGKSRLSNEGVVKRDWVPTGRIDFATKLNGNDDPSQPSEFKLLVPAPQSMTSVEPRPSRRGFLLPWISARDVGMTAACGLVP
jgi:hypothetical protein